VRERSEHGGSHLSSPRDGSSSRVRGGTSGVGGIGIAVIRRTRLAATLDDGYPITQPLPGGAARAHPDDVKIAEMSSLVWLGLTVVFVVAVALTGLGPKGGKPVARTALMRTARGVLVIGIVACAALGLWGAFRRASVHNETPARAGSR
jgi:hypothetical protein